jgi:hypothetical protein
MSNRNSKFVIAFWAMLFKHCVLTLLTTLNQIPKLKRLIDDMLWMYVGQRHNYQEKYLHLVEIAYNKNIDALIGKSLFEVYGQECLTLTS